MWEFYSASIEACIANDRRADNGSPDLRAQSLDRPRIENADINRSRPVDETYQSRPADETYYDLPD